MLQTDLIKTYQALGCKVIPQAWDDVCDGEVVTTYGVLVSLSSTGSSAVRTIRERDDVDPDQLIVEMRTELSARAKLTRTAIRRERVRS